MFLLDTNIVIFIFKNHNFVVQNIEKNGIHNCAISEITLAELKFGAEKSARPIFHLSLIEEFLKDVEVIPISDSIDFFAKEKAKLSKLGLGIDNFDLLIGTTATSNNMVLVTNNTKHFERISNIVLEDWTK